MTSHMISCLWKCQNVNRLIWGTTGMLLTGCLSAAELGHSTVQLHWASQPAELANQPAPNQSAIQAMHRGVHFTTSTSAAK